MLLNFHIHYVTQFGEQLAIQYLADDEPEEKTSWLRTVDGKHWTGTVDIKVKNIRYKYVLYSGGKLNRAEWGDVRNIVLPGKDIMYFEDEWRERDSINNAFITSAFTQAIFKREKSITINKKPEAGNLVFILRYGKIPGHLKMGVIGNIPELGEWEKPVIMDDAHFPFFRMVINLSADNVFLEYKFVIVNPEDHSILAWEEGQNRQYHYFVDNTKKNQVYLSHNEFRYTKAFWKGAGVAIPVFSLRTQKGMGIGEFSDLIPLADWASDTGLKMIQVLPVNDTLATMSWKDSYPYAAISVFALHPLYIHVEDIAPFKLKTDQKEYEKARQELNVLDNVDFEQVLQLKFKFFRILFQQEYPKFLKDEKVQTYIESQKTWLLPYAIFCHLRDKYETSNFNLWPDGFSTYDAISSEKYYGSQEDVRKACDFYIFLQYHADKQLTAARDYARSRGIVLKGDLPIGIFRHSTDAWVAPHLYNMDEQAGAPPDDFATLGQNWGFPTYNWEVMSQDNFTWWRRRMKQLNRYFDALRIDHILGFFRIWQIPSNQIQGTLGLFNPRLPYTREELSHFGLTGDMSRYTMPYITPEILRRKFGQDAEEVMGVFFHIDETGKIVFKPHLSSQRQIQDFISHNPSFDKFKGRLFELIAEVLLMPESDFEHPQKYNPRITLNTTYSYSQLDRYSQDNVMRLYNDYYYNRHEEFWRDQAYWKLPPIIDASDMLICAEDLGMIPKSVSGVLKDLNILSLEIQRMPKGASTFGQTREYPYFSVCSPSSHDMSTIRGWWESDHDNAKNFYYHYLHWQGLVPMSCEPAIVEAIVNDHMSSPSMLAIFPVQDLVGMDKDRRKQDAFSEQINEPSNPDHYWRFRFHLNVEDLLKAEDLNIRIRQMIVRNGRG
jgi:4-alpha-glucanotransferase